ncbi:YoaH family protein [Candidatus Steffania adelgidicola]|uniref:YoaH family protein n=1 Tax=Candidatus Steffania adelgidicola TaxID=1076626 RepID=UPI001D0160E6|nr:YoaH family protein [Candidatus Steffania adelgidicola]UDG80213.1 hypothetical protein GFK82_00797 [Candidatus Steffania adelgidicola]
MLKNIPTLTHQQQQEAVEKIQALMANGISSGVAITEIAHELYANHVGERISLY